MGLLSELIGRSSAAQRVLSLLLSAPGQELHTREIVRRTGADPHSVHLALSHLLAAGAVRSRRVGNLRLWSVDPKNQQVESVRDLLRREGVVPAVLARALSEMQEIRVALVFGSFASGADAAASDIDVLLIGRPDWKRLAGVAGAIDAEVGREVNFVVLREADLRNPKAGQRRLLASVLSHPRIYLKGSDSDVNVSGPRLAAAIRNPSDAGRRKRRRRTAETSAREDASRPRKNVASGEAVRPGVDERRARAPR